MRRIFKQKILTSLVMGLALAGTLIAFLFLSPESVRFKSADACFELQGEIGAPDQVYFHQRLDLAGPFKLENARVYEIYFGTKILPKPWLLTLCADARWGPVNEFSIYAFDDYLSAWRRLQSVVDPANQTLAAEIRTPFSLWTAGPILELPIPDFHAGLFNELTAWPPEGAVGYKVYAADSLVNGEFVLREELAARGGCEGKYASGWRQSKSLAEKKSGEGVYRLIAVWELAEGCKDGEEINPEI